MKLPIAARPFLTVSGRQIATSGAPNKDICNARMSHAKNSGGVIAASVFAPSPNFFSKQPPRRKKLILSS
ncbi:hypothetical protein OKA05_10185 [Luteolibacter arcticus]|uniref:Uncharacterized protein n=1 Tax=Luteolibacter arcticus TaxID=1581411 RepID=A0ABT3GH56_9BACT|nr:hypothetical protein [Luteolibacter arcticus]MCW1922920.1 hypothetical protein [Luteolibacter arcticus]